MYRVFWLYRIDFSRAEAGGEQCERADSRAKVRDNAVGTHGLPKGAGISIDPDGVRHHAGIVCEGVHLVICSVAGEYSAGEFMAALYLRRTLQSAWQIYLGRT